MLPRRNKLFSEVHHISKILVAHIKDQRLHLSGLVATVVVHFLNKIAFALNAAVSDLADFLRIERFPRLIVQVFIEGNNKDGIDEVDEGVANIAHVVQVLRQIEVVVATLVQPIDPFEKHLFSVLVWDVPYHDGCAAVLTVQDAIQVYHKLGIFLALSAVARLLR